MKIEDGIEIMPEKKAGRPRLYNFNEMKVGQCATVDASYQTIHSSLKRFKRQFPKWDFRVRKHGKKVRIWRLPDVSD